MSTAQLTQGRPLSVGVLGVGAMGAPMARNLLATHAEVWLHSRRRESAESLLSTGANWASTAAELARRTSIIIVALPRLEDLEALLDGRNGLLAGVGAAGLAIVVTSTCSPTGVRELAGRLADSHPTVELVDAPLSGGVEGASRGALSIMVGHDGPLDSRVDAVLRALGTPIVLGPVGAGQVAKACNQLIVSATVLAIAESIAIAERAGISVDELLPVLNGGYAGSTLLATKLTKFISQDYSPNGKAAFMLKDLRFATEEARKNSVRAPVLGASLAQFEALVAAGLGEADLAVARRFVELDSPEAPR